MAATRGLSVSSSLTDLGHLPESEMGKSSHFFESIQDIFANLSFSVYFYKER
jgi:hypothetical protein